MDGAVFCCDGRDRHDWTVLTPDQLLRCGCGCECECECVRAPTGQKQGEKALAGQEMGGSLACKHSLSSGHCKTSRGLVFGFHHAHRSEMSSYVMAETQQLSVHH